MIRLSEATAIALHSMIYIGNREEQVISIKEIAEKFKISENHLSKVLQRLVKEGFLTSSKGPKGGFKIVEKFKDLSFLEIYEVIDGKKKSRNCIFNSPTVRCENCIMGGLLDKVDYEFTNYMQNNKISSFNL